MILLNPPAPTYHLLMVWAYLERIKKSTKDLRHEMVKKMLTTTGKLTSLHYRRQPSSWWSKFHVDPQDGSTDLAYMERTKHNYRKVREETVKKLSNTGKFTNWLLYATLFLANQVHYLRIVVQTWPRWKQ